MAEQFYTILTNSGKAKIANSVTLGTKVNLTTLKVGDSNGTYYNPSESQTDLVHSVYSCNVTSVAVDETNSNWINVICAIPSDVGDFYIREAGVFDDTGALIAIGKYPETYKPTATDGSTKELYIKMTLEVTNTNSVELKIDPTVILATKNDINILANSIASISTQLSKNVQQQNILSLQNNSWGYKGICARNWIAGAFSSQYYKDRIDECIEKLNIDSVSIIPNTYQQNQTSNDVEYRTPVSTSETKDFINYCKSKNLKIMLKPQVESDDGTWRADYNPTDANAWFNSYKAMIVKWAQLAEDTKCEMFSIGSEYRSLTNDTYKQKWVDIIDAVRNIYSGIILYSSNCNATLGDEYETLSFWDLVDVIGLDNYLIPTTNIATPIEDYDILMQNNYQNQNMIQPIDFLAKKYNKPIIFAEYGISTTDDNYQSNYIESYFKNYGNYDWNRGMFLWVIEPENILNNFYPIGRKTEATIKKYYSQYTKTQKIDYPQLFTTLSTTDSNTYWAKIANVKLVNYSIVEGCIELMQEQVNAGIGITLSELKFRIYSDGMNYPVKVNLKLNQNAYVLPSQITYVITEDDVNYKNIDIYIKITQSVKYSFLLKTISEKKIIKLFDKYPLLSVLPSGTQGNPSGNYILAGTLSGSMNSGIISQQVTLPNPVNITFAGATCTALSGGNTCDVNVNVEIVDNTHINITGKHMSVNGNYGYTIKWVVIGN